MPDASKARETHKTPSLRRVESQLEGITKQSLTESKDITPCWKAVPLVTIINALGILIVLVWAFVERAPITRALNAFGFDMEKWETYVTILGVCIIVIDLLIVTYATAVSNYCLNHKCGRVLVRRPPDLPERQANSMRSTSIGGDCCYCACTVKACSQACCDCCARFMGTWVQRILVVLAYAMAILFTCAVAMFTMGAVLLVMFDGACVPLRNGEGSALKDSLKSILINSVDNMGESFYTEESLNEYHEDLGTNCATVREAVDPANRLWVLCLLLACGQWNLAITAYGNYVRVDATEKTKALIIRNLKAHNYILEEELQEMETAREI